MPTANSVQDLIDLLHIDVIGLIESRHDQIREAYVVPPVAEDFEDFKRITVDYVRYHNCEWYGLDFGTDRAWDQVRTVLNDIFPPEPSLSRIQGFLDAQGSYIQAVKNSITGRHGGLIAVVDSIAVKIKQNAVRQWIQSVFLTGIDPLNYARKVEFACEYLDRYGHLLLT